MVIYQFNNILDTQKKYTFRILAKEAKISGIDLQQYIIEFENEFKYDSSIIHLYKLLSQETIDTVLFNQIKRFYAKFQNLIFYIKIYNKNSHRILFKNENNYFTISSILKNNSVKNLIKKPEIKQKNESLSYLRTIRHEGVIVGVIEIQLNLPRAINHELRKNHYTGKKSWYWCIDEKGKIISFCNTEKKMETADLKIHKLSQIVQAINENFQGFIEHFIFIDDKKIDVFSAYYPIKIFNKNYGVIFSIDRQKWFGPIKSKTLTIICSFLLMITFIVIVFVSVIKQRQKAEKNLVKSEAQIKNILKSLQAGVVIIDTNTRKIKFANQVAADMAMTSVENMLGKICHEFICPSEKNSCPFSDKGQIMDNSEKILLTTNGNELNILKTIKPLEYEEKACLLETFIDITDRKKAELKLVEINKDLKHQTALANELAIKAEAANKAKSEFLANMSHEIRTPMNAIIGFNSLLEKTRLSARQKNFVHKGGCAAKSLLGIINDILDFSKIEADKLNIDKVEFNLDDVLEHISSVAGMLAFQKGLEFIISKDSKIPDNLIGDPLRLGQILLNFVNNAVKFTEKGKVIVKVFLKEKHANEARLYFEVSDTGIGITPEQKKKLFRPFTQADYSTTRKYGGTGLGLTISNHLVNIMGGKIDVKTEYGKGSVFSFDLVFSTNEKKDDPGETIMQGINSIPKKPVGQSVVFNNILNEFGQETTINRKRNVELPQDFDAVRGAKILVVEDNEINQEVARGILEKEGFSVETADDGIEALEKINANCDYDLILMDLQMPNLDGYGATKKIRKNPAFASIPIIALSANAMKGTREKVKKFGMNDYITKPIDIKELLTILNKWVRPGKEELLEDNKNHENFDLNGIRRGFTSIDIDDGLSRVLGDLTLYFNILNKFLKTNQNTMAEIETTIDQKNIETALGLIHTLKGVAGNIGAVKVSESAKKLEAALKSEVFDITAIRILINETRSSLNRVLEEIKNAIEKMQETKSFSQNDKKIDEEMIKALFIELKQLLKEYDTDASDIMGEIAKIVEGSEYADEIDKIKNAIDSYNFDEAHGLCKSFMDKYRKICS